jgi:hypothetical protein
MEIKKILITFVHQPEYLPWLGFFDKLARCDTFVIYDDTQYVHGGYQNRNRVRTAKGWRWLTVPIVHNHPQKIKDVRISGVKWRENHLRLIEHSYHDSPYFKQYFPMIKSALTFDHELLIGLNIRLINLFVDILGIKVKIMRSSEFPHLGKGKNEKLVSICKFLGSETYLSGSGGKTYIDEALFSSAKIKIIWHNYNHPIYKQPFNGFCPNMSIIDLLFSAGSQTKDVILKGGLVNNNSDSMQFITAVSPLIVPEK